MTTDHEPLSVATEVALLFLSELESRISDNPDLLVSTEAILSFAAVRRADPVTWQHWRRILEKYEKVDLIEHMLGAPLPLERGDGGSAADRLIRLVLETGIEFFHDPDQHGWASVRVDGHFENHPIRSRPFQLFLLRNYYRETGQSPGVQAIRATMELFEAKACLTARNLASMCGSQITEANFISTYATALGGRSRSTPKVGG